MSLFDLEKKVALVTGAAGGLGHAIAEQFLQHGAQVILTDIDAESVQEVADQLSADGHSCTAIHCDLGNRESVNSLINEAQSWQGRVDILVCCGGMEGFVGSLAEVSDEDWDALMTVNLKSAHWLASALLPGMADRGSGSIMFIASIAGLRGNKAIGLYGIAKAGLSQMARNLAVEWGPKGITVNAIAPGLIETPLSTSLMSDPAFMVRRLAMTPLRRVGQPEEIAGIAVLLASRAGGFITGQTLVADGGTLITDGN